MVREGGWRRREGGGGGKVGGGKVGGGKVGGGKVGGGKVGGGKLGGGKLGGGKLGGGREDGKDGKKVMYMWKRFQGEKHICNLCWHMKVTWEWIPLFSTAQYSVLSYE